MSGGTSGPRITCPGGHLVRGDILSSDNGVTLGSAYKTETYKTETTAREFTHFIAESQRQELVLTLESAKFFSLLLDGSTDAGNLDNELLLVVWCDQEGEGECVRTRISYFTVTRPASVSAEGLFDVLGGALQSLSISSITREECSKLVGLGTDGGASANIARAGLKGLVEQKLPWVFWMWCLAHRLELAIKDALKTTSFTLIDEMLLRLYLLYEKSPKKCRELEEIMTHLKECLSDTSVRACGSRWISHMVGAMKRVISKYGVYTNHLATLSEDTSLKSTVSLPAITENGSTQNIFLAVLFFVIFSYLVWCSQRSRKVTTLT